jgi:hypothetical protein
MPSETGASPKTCVVCAIDLSNRPRVKDRRGRYFCRPCYEKALKKAKARKAQRAAAKPAGPAALESASAAPPAGVDDLMALGSGEAVAQQRPGQPRCPACGQAMPAGITSCRACGYIKPQPVAAATIAAARPKTTAAPSAEGVLRVLKNPLAILIGVTGVFLLMFLMARTSPELVLLYLVVVSIYALAIGIWLLVEAFRTSITDGVLCLICGIYTLYFIIAKCHNRHLQAAYVAAVVGHLLVFLIPGGRELFEVGPE